MKNNIRKKILVSVIMSVYNETEKEIIEAVNSVLEQDFNGFEFIIVNDRPGIVWIKELLDVLAAKDSRIIVLSNEKNIGLALSMNKAAEIAKSDILVRMDADDISLTTRFSKQYDLMMSKGYDLICTNYTNIDIESKSINSLKPVLRYYDSDRLPYVVSNSSYIHHPTVMIKKSIFDKVGGYRNFPCSQDRDLWLRLLDEKCSFFMIDEVLLLYRIRDNSIGRSKRLLQHLTINYIEELFLQRINKGVDYFSESEYIAYLDKYSISSKSVENNYLKATSFAQIAKVHSEGNNRLGAFLYRVLTFLTSSVYRNNFILKVLNKQKIKSYIKSTYSIN